MHLIESGKKEKIWICVRRWHQRRRVTFPICSQVAALALAQGQKPESWEEKQLLIFYNVNLQTMGGGLISLEWGNCPLARISWTLLLQLPLHYCHTSTYGNKSSNQSSHCFFQERLAAIISNVLLCLLDANAQWNIPAFLCKKSVTDWSSCCHSIQVFDTLFECYSVALFGIPHFVSTALGAVI